MPTINELNAATQISGSDLLPIFSQSNGDARKISITTLLQYIARSFASPEFQQQWATPGASGFAIQVNDSANNTWLIINPAGGYAAGSIVLPSVSNCVDGQEILVNCSQQVNSFSVDGNGAIAVQGAPTALGADDFFRLRFQYQTKIWYRVG